MKPEGYLISIRAPDGAWRDVHIHPERCDAGHLVVTEASGEIARIPRSHVTACSCTTSNLKQIAA